MRMCETLYSFDSDGIFFCRSRNWSISRGLTLMRRDHVALAQDLHREFSAQDLVAIGGVVDALAGERLGQIGERDLVAARPRRCSALFSVLIRDLDAGAIARAASAAPAAPGGRAPAGAARSAAAARASAARRRSDDGHHLLVELAREDHAFVDGGGHPIEQHAGARGFAGLGEAPRRRRSEQQQN